MIVWCVEHPYLSLRLEAFAAAILVGKYMVRVSPADICILQHTIYCLELDLPVNKLQ